MSEFLSMVVFTICQLQYSLLQWNNAAPAYHYDGLSSSPLIFRDIQRALMQCPWVYEWVHMLGYEVPTL